MQINRSWKALLGAAVFCGVLSFGAAFAARDADTLVAANAVDVKTLDPIYTGDAGSSNTFLQIYDHLIFQDKDGKLSPRLAESWEQPDPMTYVLHLRKGVKFHNGMPFTAVDAKFTIDRGMSSLTATGSNVLLKDIDNVEIVDDYTIAIHMKQPYTPLLYAFSEVWGSVVCKAAVEELKDQHAMNPVGTGPFKFVEWKKGNRVILERNDDYWGEKPPFKRLIIRAVPETSVRTIELESGAVDVSYQIHVNDIKRIEKNPHLSLVRRPALRAEFMLFNCSKAPLNDVRVRRAIVKALDIQGMQRAVYRGLGYVPAGPLPEAMRYCDKTLPKPVRDIEGAKALLKEAGVKDLHVVISVNEAKERIDAATITQAQLAEVGITAEIRVLEYGALLDMQNRGEHQITFSGWGNNLPDPEYALSRLYHTRGLGTTNIAFYSNPTFDKLLDDATRVPDGPEREALYKEVQKMFIEEAPAVYWNIGEYVTGINSDRIADFPNHIRGIYEFNTVKFK